MGFFASINPINIITSVVDGVKEYAMEGQKRKTLRQEHDQELNKLEHEVKLHVVKSKLEMAKSGQQIDFSLDQQAMKNMEKSWKDELILVVFLVPMVLAFVPSYSAYILQGFQVIEKMPEWYIYVIIGMVVVIYGMRGMLRDVLKLLINKISFKSK